MTSSGCHSVKLLSTTVGHSLVAMVQIYVVLSLVIRVEHGIHCRPCSNRIISEMLPDIHTMEKFDFLKSMIHSQII